MLEENEDLIENEDQPGTVPARPLRPSELLILKSVTQDCLDHLSGLAAELKTVDFESRIPTAEGLTFGLSQGDAEEILNDAGKLCDAIIEYSRTELKKLDLKKPRVKK